MNQHLDTYQPSAPMEPMAPVSTDVLTQLQSYAEAWGAASQIAEQMSRTDFAGPFKGKPADMAAAILKGTSIGIPPADIGKAIYVVHGTPSLYGKTALAIALQHGYIVETLEDTPQAVTVKMTAPHGQEMEVRYTIERATQEGLVKGNKVQYETRPSKMLYWKCIGELTDRMIPHLTGGMPIKEDAEQSPVKMTATRQDRPQERGADAVRAALAAKNDPAPEPEQPEVVAPSLEEIAAAPDMGTLSELMGRAQHLVPEEEYEPYRQAGNDRAAELAHETD